MSNDISSAREVQWFKKLNTPTSGVYRLAHAVRVNGAKPFKAGAVYDLIDASAEAELAKHVEATSLLTAREKKAVKRPAADVKKK
jgi:hypothetical protein